MKILIQQYLLFTICVILISNNLNSQSISSIEDVDILENQTEVLIRKYPHLFYRTEINGIEKIDKNHSIIRYTRNDENYETIVNSGRKDMLLIATCRAISKAETPEIIINRIIEIGYSDNQIQNYYIVNTPYKSDFYRLDVHEKNNVKSLFFDRIGQYVKPPY